MTEPTLNVAIPLTPGSDVNLLLARVRQAVAAACDPAIRSFAFSVPAVAAEAPAEAQSGDAAAAPAAAGPRGWADIDVRAVVLGLPSKQRDVIKAAIDNGGQIDRDATYAIIKRSKDKRLTGFTKPIDNAMEALKKNGTLHDDAKPLLIPIYKGSGQAKAFRVPEEVVQRWKQLA
ncbi:hypothetical protein [uncultured Massilia sp.]|uniref:hypothetical protein n=1 Tax=uncultured Massilia sp. TaxID=169973 RepID=UPI0025E41C93|nr:hypothetical protein [uncultured Massilia sp.]